MTSYTDSEISASDVRMSIDTSGATWTPRSPPQYYSPVRYLVADMFRPPSYISSPRHSQLSFATSTAAPPYSPSRPSPSSIASTVTLHDCIPPIPPVRVSRDTFGNSIMHPSPVTSSFSLDIVRGIFPPSPLTTISLQYRYTIVTTRPCCMTTGDLVGRQITLVPANSPRRYAAIIEQAVYGRCSATLTIAYTVDCASSMLSDGYIILDGWNEQLYLGSSGMRVYWHILHWLNHFLCM